MRAEDLLTGWSGDSSGGSSESEGSDSEGSLGSGDRFHSSRVRLAALNCLQVCSRPLHKVLRNSPMSCCFKPASASPPFLQTNHVGPS